MEPKFQSSFIPKKPIAAPTQQKRRGSRVSIVFIITLVLFLAILGLSVGIFLYAQFLEGSIERKSVALERARSEFEPALIQELTRLDARIGASQQLLRSHVAPSTLFAALEGLTLEAVQFQGFRFEVLPDGRIQLTMRGRARSFNAVAVQADVFGRSGVFLEPIFSNLDVDVRGDVTFDFAAFADPGLLSYTQSLANRPQSSEPVPAPTTDSGSETPPSGDNQGSL